MGDVRGAIRPIQGGLALRLPTLAAALRQKGSFRVSHTTPWESGVILAMLLPLTDECYPGRMNGITIKLDLVQMRWLTGQAKARGRSKGAILRELIEERRTANGARSLHERMKDLCGSLEGSPTFPPAASKVMAAIKVS